MSLHNYRRRKRERKREGEREGGREGKRGREGGKEEGNRSFCLEGIYKRPWYHSNPLRVESKCGMIDTACVVMNDPKMASRHWSTMAMEDAGAKWMTGS